LTTPPKENMAPFPLQDKKRFPDVKKTVLTKGKDGTWGKGTNGTGTEPSQNLTILMSDPYIDDAGRSGVR